MPRIFWTPKRKARLLKQSKKMTVNEMAKSHMQPVAEIERMLLQLSPDKRIILRVYKEKGIKVTVYRPAYAAGIMQQRIGSFHALY